MPRHLHLFAASALALVFCLPGHGQDSPSLGDLARQVQKDKSNAPAKKVFTNDNLPMTPTFGSSALVPGSGRIAQPGAPGKQTTAAASPSDELGRMESLLNQLDTLDSATLAKNVLQGSDVNFPGRSDWEARLFQAKQVFVAQGRDIMKKASQLSASAQSVQDVKNTNDPRARDLDSRLQQLLQEAKRSGEAFQAVIAEGKASVGQSSSH